VVILNKLNYLISKSLVAIILFAISFYGFDLANTSLIEMSERGAISGSLIFIIAGMLALVLIAHMSNPDSYLEDAR